MTQSPARTEMVKRLCEAAVQDDRIVGLVDFGSGGQGRIDEWSDIDVAVILCDTDYPDFRRNWITWAKQFGDILLANKYNDSFPWTIYATEPVPLRVDFAFYPESDLFVGHRLSIWPKSNEDIERMVWYETDTEQITEYLRQHIGQQETLPIMKTEFERKSDYFWHSLQYLYGKFQRGEVWVARVVLHKEVLERLLFLLRIEAQAFDRWNSANIAWNIEHSLTPQRLEQLNACIAPADRQGFNQCLHNTTQLGYEVCTVLGNRYEASWSKALAEILLEITADISDKGR